MIGLVGEESAWMTWSEAAELVGCPVPTIETYVRTGRIARRGRHGPRPTLNRASVEEFASWWRDETARRERAALERASRDDRRIRPPEPEGWIQAAEAADLLGYYEGSHVVWLVGQGKLEGRKVSTRWWVREAEVHEYAQQRDQWVSQVKAAEIVGCSVRTIERAVAAGKIEKRDVHRTAASLAADSVGRFAKRFSLTN